jgi:hypothetical protein
VPAICFEDRPAAYPLDVQQLLGVRAGPLAKPRQQSALARIVLGMLLVLVASIVMLLSGSRIGWARRHTGRDDPGRR